MEIYNIDSLNTSVTEWANSFGYRIPLGFSSVDRRIGGGLHKGELMLVIAYPSGGKTTWVLNSLFANSNYRAVFFSIDMMRVPVYEKLVAIANGVQLLEVDAPIDMEMFNKTKERLPNLHIIDQVAINTEDIAETIQALNADIAYIDFLQLVDPLNVRQHNLTIDAICRELRGIGQELNCAMVALHQPSRTSGKPTMALTMQSGQFGGEQQADYVVGLYRPYLGHDTLDTCMVIQLLKSRGKGGVDIIGTPYKWYGSYGRIEEAEVTQDGGESTLYTEELE